MTADEAKELTEGSINYKGPIYKAKLWYLCGLLNKRIENRAEKGYITAKLEANENTARKYFPLMKTYYEDLGYSVAFDIKDQYHNWQGDSGIFFVVCWNYKELKYCNKDSWKSFSYHSEHKEPVN